ncbi:hypothetical protein M011DRAFT_397577 [Sporormia fimetaria CBS 119925]|uniref:UBX domain-containing protein n=1 Tax=Sporormia fimetaria CBS 119925 TaxID=1340428 RepID=A0A6A6VK55_9PLEO|nr:hypothetical protein M011DRAFT_397577 [Sporormia fimetaria CBS 119925]
MSHVVVFNSSAKTVKIPTNPTKYLTEVRDEACQKFNVSKDHFTLKYNNKPISLSQQIRLANLPQGARLELVQSSRSPTVISVALQLPASENNVRLMQKFASNISLWEILRQFESGEGANCNFTQRGVPELASAGSSGPGRLNYEMPVITVMPGHREHSTFVDLQKTLSQLGFDSGSALLRLSFKNSGKPLEEAMAEISQYFKSSGPVPSSGSAETAKAPVAASPSAQNEPAAAAPAVGSDNESEPVPREEPMEVDAEPQRAIDAVAPTEAQPSNVEPPSASNPPMPQSASIGSKVQIYAAPTSATPMAAQRAFNEGDYVPTIEHAKIHQASLQARTRNQRLLSDKELAEQENARLEKLAAVAEKGSSVRIRLPDQTMIQTSISKEDTAESLYAFVEQYLQYKEPFKLKYFSPSNGRQVVIARDNKLLIQELRFSTAELITFVWDENASADARLSRQTLAKEWQAKAEPLKVNDPVADDQPEPVAPQSKSEGKKKAGSSGADRESKLKNITSRLFKR